jgi:hypothetical protein
MNPHLTYAYIFMLKYQPTRLVEWNGFKAVFFTGRQDKAVNTHGSIGSIIIKYGVWEQL